MSRSAPSSRSKAAMKRSSRNSRCAASVCAQPVEVRQVGAGDEARIVDLEAGRQQVGDQHARGPVVRLGDLQHDDEALVLRDLGDVGLLTVERVVGALDREAVAAGRQRLSRRGDRGHHRLHRVRCRRWRRRSGWPAVPRRSPLVEKPPVCGAPLTSSCDARRCRPAARAPPAASRPRPACWSSASRRARPPRSVISSGTTDGIGLLSAASASMAAPSRSVEP